MFPYQMLVGQDAKIILWNPQELHEAWTSHFASRNDSHAFVRVCQVPHLHLSSARPAGRFKMIPNGLHEASSSHRLLIVAIVLFAVIIVSRPSNGLSLHCYSCLLGSQPAHPVIFLHASRNSRHIERHFSTSMRSRISSAHAAS